MPVSPYKAPLEPSSSIRPWAEQTGPTPTQSYVLLLPALILRLEKNPISSDSPSSAHFYCAPAPWNRDRRSWRVVRSALGVTSFLAAVPSQHPSLAAQLHGANKSGDMSSPLQEARLAHGTCRVQPLSAISQMPTMGHQDGIGK